MSPPHPPMPPPQPINFITQVEFARLEREVNTLRAHFHDMNGRMTPLVNMPESVHLLTASVNELSKIVRVLEMAVNKIGNVDELGKKIYAIEMALAESRGSWKITIAALSIISGAVTSLIISAIQKFLF